VVEHLPYHPKVMGLSPANVNGSERTKMANKLDRSIFCKKKFLAVRASFDKYKAFFRLV